MTQEEFSQKSKKDFINISKILANTLSKGDILLLFGNLGSGKTYFTRKLCTSLRVKMIVNSPSYVLLNEYEGKYKIFHYDLYRLSTPEEAIELGILDRLSDGITIIEWAEIVQDVLPKERIELFFEHNGKYRNLKIVRRQK